MFGSVTFALPIETRGLEKAVLFDSKMGETHFEIRWCGLEGSQPCHFSKSIWVLGVRLETWVSRSLKVWKQQHVEHLVCFTIYIR